MAAPKSSNPETDSTGPAIIFISRRFRLVSKLKSLSSFLFVGSLDSEDRPESSHVSKSSGKHLSSIEIDPDDESRRARGESSSSSDSKNRSFREQCVTVKGYAWLIVWTELLGLFYLLATSAIIFVKEPICAWYFQPFLAPLWSRHPTTVFATTCVFCSTGFVCIVCLTQALDERRRWPRLILPHLVMQILTIFGSFMFCLIALILLLTRGTFALRMVELASGSLSNGILGVGNIVLGLEYGRMESAAAELVLMNAGIASVSFRRKETNNSIPLTTASSVVHYNMVGAIWEAFNYELALVVALMVFGVLCAIQIFAWLFIRQLYARNLLKRTKARSLETRPPRRRYRSEGTTV